MTDADPFEDRLRASLDHHAEAVAAPPGPVSAIVHRSHRRMVRRRAAGALAGVGSLVLAAGIVTRESTDIEVRAASGSGSTTTSSPGGSTTSVPGTTTPPPSTTAAPGTTVVPPIEVTTTVLPDDGLGPTPGLLVPDQAATGILSSVLRIAVDPARGLSDSELVTVRGSQFPPGSKIGLIMCSTDGLKATTLNQGAGWCDITTNAGFASPGGATVGADGTFTAEYRVKRNLSTMGGAYDCALGTADPDDARELRDQGLLGPTSYPEGVWGCSVVAVVTGMQPNGDGSSTIVYLDATAEMVTFRR